jgi:hypothetical protein
MFDLYFIVLFYYLLKKSMTDKKFATIQVKIDQKKKLRDAAYKLSIDVEERVTVTSLLYTLLDNFLDEAVEIKRKEY